MSQLQAGVPARTSGAHTSYDDNRADFPIEELEKCIGLWVAFSEDGTRIVDSCKSLSELQTRLRIAGRDPHDLVFSRIPSADEIQSGSEFS
jgi:hypothetical protein